MRHLLRRHGVAAFVGVLAALALLPQAASATEACGSALLGSGASLQNIAQTEVWSSGWKGGACEAKPTVKYTATSSGKGMEQWGSVSGKLGGSSPEKPLPAFVATDIAPEGPAETSGTQLNNMAKAGSILEGAVPDEVAAVPVAQSAVAMVVSLPSECTAEESGGKASVKSKTLEEEWEKDLVSDKELLANVKFLCKKEALLTAKPTLEASSSVSGITAAVKRYLEKVGPTKNEFLSLTETAEKSASTTWPKTLPSGEPKETGNTTAKALAETVRKTAGTIGFVDLSDAVAVGFTAKPTELEKGHQSFFVQVQNNSKEAKEVEYASPESSSKASNCAGAEYAGAPSEVAPGKDWSKVIDSSYEAGKSTSYPLCTLTYDLLWNWYEVKEPSAYETFTKEKLFGVPELEAKPAYTLENEAAVINYLRYIVSTEAQSGGQNKTLEEKHYAKLPSEMQKEVAADLDVRSEEAPEEAESWPTKAEQEEAEKHTGEAGSGAPWLVSVGDSYIGGEAGRWAGNSSLPNSEENTDALGSSAYLNGGSVETTPGCHRSASAEVYIGRKGIHYEEPYSENFACTGSKVATEWSTNNQCKPGVDFKVVEKTGKKCEGQALLLERFALKHDVKLVAVSIGGNNFNFASVAEACVTAFFSFTRTPCKDNATVTNNFLPAEVRARTATIRSAISNVREAMLKAGYRNNMYTIVVQNYPSPIPVNSTEFRSGQGRTENRGRDGCPFLNEDAKWANETALGTINRAVHTAGEQTGLENVKFLNISSAFAGRRLCENGVTPLEENGALGGRPWNAHEAAAASGSEWINKIRINPILFGRNYQPQERLHPNYWGQLALRNCLRSAYHEGDPVGGKCKPQEPAELSEFTRGEPVMSLISAREFNVEKAGEATTTKSQTFTIGSITVTCTSATFKWAQEGVASVFVLTPSYSGCTATGGGFEKVSTSITVKECGFVVGEPPSEADESELITPEGCVVELKATFTSECHVKVEGPQELEKVVSKDLKSTKGSFEGELSFEVAKLAYTSEGSGCAGAGISKEGTGEYKGKVVEKGAIVE